MQEIKTPRLLIRRFRADDKADFLVYQGSPEVLAFMDALPMNDENADLFLKLQAEAGDGARGRYHAFAVEHCGEGKVIGDVGFFLQVERPEGDLGFQFHPAYQGLGYALEAAMALVRVAFGEWELENITSGCDARNVRSFRLMERLGMKRVEHRVQSRTTKGSTHDEYVYALTRDDWIAAQN